MGFSQDIEAARIFAIYQDPLDSCDVVVMTYPGQTVEFDEASYPDAAKPSCIDLDLEYGYMWTQTLSGEHNNQVRLYEAVDPFGILESVISITTEIHVIDETGNINSLYGLFGMHFDIDLFKKTIDPLLENEASDYTSNILYWVYSVKQTLNDGNTVTADSAIFKNELAVENTLSDDVFQ